MGRGISKSKRTSAGNNRTAKSNNTQICRREKIPAEGAKLSEVLYKTRKHFFPEFRNWLEEIVDPRNKNKIIYDLKHVVWVGILLFLCKLASRRQIKFNFNTQEIINNINLISESIAEQIEHPDTLAYLLERLNPECLSKLRTKLIRELIRKKCLERYRLLGLYYLIVIDGTGHLVFKKRHCKHCLTKKVKTKNGKTVTYYYHHELLEAKLVCSNGLVFSVATEFIENVDPRAKKQDCELNAFRRLTEKLKESFPQLRICLLLDSLYAAIPVIEICEKNGWKYIITFKSGSMPNVYQEYESLKELSKENFAEYKDEKIKQEFYWVEDVLHYKEETTCVSNVLECVEFNGKGKTRFVWLTNFNVNQTNYQEIAGGGRLRWKIENEGFNVQKTWDYNLEHAYSKDNNAIKNFYFLLQIAHILSQLMEKGSLLIETIKKVYGSIQNFSRKLLESLRRDLLSLEKLQNEFLRPFQIRLDTS